MTTGILILVVLAAFIARLGVAAKRWAKRLMPCCEHPEGPDACPNHGPRTRTPREDSVTDTTRWLVCPWFDEGDDWPEAKGSDAVVSATTEEEAIAEYDRRWGPFTGLNSYEATREEAWGEGHRLRAETVALLGPELLPKSEDSR